MDKKYNVKVNDEFKFNLESNEIANMDIVAIERQRKFAKFHIIRKNKSLQAEILKSDFLRKSYSVQINSNVYEVKISDELDLLIEKMGLSLGNVLAINEIHAPMPGLILDVNIREGDAVKEGDQLLVLEAMKMENTLTAPRDGVVKSVSVEKGQTVEKNELLIEME